MYVCVTVEQECAERDYQLASGLSQDVETDDSVFRQTTARLPWLLIGMLGGIGNSMILGNFDTTFAAHPEMALYIPLIGGTGGNVGTQSSALVVQGLANSSLDANNTWKQILKESVVALINATIISLLVYIYNSVCADRRRTDDLQLRPFRRRSHCILFRFTQPFCRRDVRIHLRHVGPDDFGKAENRPRHCHRSVHLHYQ